jgi:hypothetical protein
MLHDLGFTPFQYGLGFGIPCLGGILGARCPGRLLAAMGHGESCSASALRERSGS